MVELELAVDHELVGAVGEVDEGDAVAVDVAHPVDGGRGANGEDGAFDVQVVALARAHHDAMGAKPDGAGVAVGGAVLDADFHRRGPNLMADGALVDMR